MATPERALSGSIASLSDAIGELAERLVVARCCLAEALL